MDRNMKTGAKIINATAIVVMLSIIFLGAKGGSMNNGKLKKGLTPLQYHVTQENGTERPFQNKYWDNKKPGIYVDVVSGEPLFSSLDKYDSKSGWPSFIKPLKNENIIEKVDNSHGMSRVEVRSKEADSHLGHVFNDGPRPMGLRYCINSAALRFIPVENLSKEGYSDYLTLFNNKNVKSLKTGNSTIETATFAAGCFWGVEAAFKELKGVLETTVGYTGGFASNPNYKQVCTGASGHAEAVKLTYDSNIISYSDLVDYFWRIHNPTTRNRQGPDLGSQYRSAIFYHNEEQKREAELSKNSFDRSGVFNDKVVTEIVPAKTFYDAEGYHQDYYDKKGVKGCHYVREK